MDTQLERDPTSVDNSGEFFSFYSEMATKEDNLDVKRWQKDAGSILIFVSHCVVIHTAIRMHWNTIDRFILRCSLCTTCLDRPRHKAQPSGQLRRDILPPEHLSDSRRPKRRSARHIYSSHSSYSTPILSSEIRHRGEFLLVFELGYESYRCPLGNVVTTMDTSLHQKCSVTRPQSRGASANSCIPSPWQGQRVYYPFPSGRSIACPAAHLSFPLLCRPPRFSIQYHWHRQPHCLHRRNTVDRVFLIGVWMHQLQANSLAQQPVSFTVIFKSLVTLP